MTTLSSSLYIPLGAVSLTWQELNDPLPPGSGDLAARCIERAESWAPQQWERVECLQLARLSQLSYSGHRYRLSQDRLDSRCWSRTPETNTIPERWDWEYTHWLWPSEFIFSYVDGIQLLKGMIKLFGHLGLSLIVIPWEDVMGSRMYESVI